MKIVVNYQSSILVNDEICFDPLNIGKGVSAKYIFFTHPHWDHFSPKDIKKILTKSTTFVCPSSMQEEVEKHFPNKIFAVEPGKKYTLDDLTFEVVPAYNLTKKFHPRENNWVGYTLDIDGQRITITGDTDMTEELAKVKTDILLLPIGGTYTMNCEEAAKLTNLIKPKLVIPTHYGAIVGSKADGKEFQKLIDSNIKCELQL